MQPKQKPTFRITHSPYRDIFSRRPGRSISASVCRDLADARLLEYQSSRLFMFAIHFPPPDMKPNVKCQLPANLLLIVDLFSNHYPVPTWSKDVCELLLQNESISVMILCKSIFDIPKDIARQLHTLIIFPDSRIIGEIRSYSGLFAAMRTMFDSESAPLPPRGSTRINEDRGRSMNTKVLLRLLEFVAQEAAAKPNQSVIVKLTSFLYQSPERCLSWSTL
jgi:hypothetical protein